MERPSRHQVIMEVAYVFSSRGTCQRAQVGAAISRHGRVLVTGYNGPPSGLRHCDDQCSMLHQSGCLIAVHAEANAIAYGARYGISTEDADLYSTHLPCLQCSQLIINAGIRRVTYDQDYRIKDGLYLLQQAGVDIMSLMDREFSDS
jgi:dCMP deaminase